MKRKTSGTDDLIKTLVKQHGLAKAIDAARHQIQSPLSPARGSLWRNVYNRLKEMR